MKCYYIDHVTNGVKNMFALSDKMKLQFQCESENSMFFATCHRVELYSIKRDENVDNFLNLLSDLNVFSIEGDKQCLTRLMRIGVGLESQLLAEANIEMQLNECIGRMKDGIFKTKLTEISYDINVIRKKHNYYSYLGYNDIANNTFNKPKNNIVVLGGGMLGKMYISENHKKYNNMYVVTRYKSSVRKNLRKLIGENDRVKVCTINDVPSENVDILIVTNKLSDDYVNYVTKCHTNNENIANLCTEHLFDWTATNYVDMVSPRYNEMIETSNNKIIDKSKSVNDEIVLILENI